MLNPIIATKLRLASD